MKHEQKERWKKRHISPITSVSEQTINYDRICQVKNAIGLERKWQKCHIYRTSENDLSKSVRHRYSIGGIHSGSPVCTACVRIDGKLYFHKSSSTQLIDIFRLKSMFVRFTMGLAHRKSWFFLFQFKWNRKLPSELEKLNCFSSVYFFYVLCARVHIIIQNTYTIHIYILEILLL